MTSLRRLDAICARGSPESAGSGAVDPVGTALVSCVRRLGFLRARELRQTRIAIVDLCRAMAGELRAGRASADAFAAAVRAGPVSVAAQLLPAIAVARRGDSADLADAVARVAAVQGYDGLRSVVACWRVAAASGAALAPAIDRVADALQDEIDLGREVASTMAGPRATVHVLAGLPLIGLLLGTAIGAQPITFLFGSVPGGGCLLGALVLDACGIGWSRRIARRAARLG